MSSFFTAAGTNKKRKRLVAPEAPKKRIATSKPSGKASAKPAPPAKKRVERDESISGSDSDEPGDGDDVPAEGGSEDEEDASEREGETAAERRLRLAERYLENVRQEVNEEYGFDAEEVDKELLTERILQEDVAEAKGRVYRRLAAELAFEKASHCMFRWNGSNVNSVAVCPPFAYFGSRESFLSKFRIQDLPQDQWQKTTKKKPKKQSPPKKRPERVLFRRGDPRKAKDKAYQGHVGSILSVAASQDGKYVVTGGADRRIVVHDAETLKPLRCFPHHRDGVTGLAFRRGTNQLFSCSKDRCVKIFSLDELAYVETLFGHQDQVMAIDALAQERCVSVGGRDRTARYWKVVEESQLVFRGGGGADKKAKLLKVDPNSLAHEGSMDQVAMIDDELFVTGSDNGSLALWSTQKKKPLFVYPLAHGLDPPLEPSQASAEQNPDPRVVPPPQPRWITALRAIPYSDVILSGSWDGCIRVFKISADKRKLEAVGILGAGDGDGNDSETGQDTVANGVNGVHSSSSTNKSKPPAGNDDGDASSTGGRFIRGVVNGISTFERGDKGKDGVCVVVAIGKEHRLGRWKHIPSGKNGAMVFEVPRLPKLALANGVHKSSNEDDA